MTQTQDIPWLEPSEDLQRLKGFRLLDDDFLTKCFEENTVLDGNLILKSNVQTKVPDVKEHVITAA